MELLIVILVLLVLIVLIIITFIAVCHETFKNSTDMPFGFKPPPFNTRVQRFTNSQKFALSNRPKFQAPISLTTVKGVSEFRTAQKTKVKTVGNYDGYIAEIIQNYNKGRNEETIKRTIKDILHDIAHHDILGFHKKHVSPKDLPKNHLHYEQGNILTMPTFFDCRDKWPGCIPPASYQGTCGSCWAFAICTCLSSRIYIESCGYGGCNSYPQMNLRSVDLTENNIDTVYKYKSITLSNIYKFIDQNSPDKNPSVDINEWLSAVKRAHKIVLSDSSEGLKRFQAMQTIVYMLDFQSLGSIKFNKKNENLDELLYRAKKVFNYFADKNGKIFILDVQSLWLSQPIPLSPEKLISCCYPNCYERGQSDYNLTRDEIIERGTPQCVGSSLIDGWKVARSVGTTTTICVGYNLDSWQDGDSTPSCHQLQGPNYEYCSGFALTLGLWSEETEKQLYEYEENGLNPINENNPLVNKIPWVYPQTFKFFAKNAYEINNNMTDIQNEIIQRGPVTTGFVIYSDFQDEFGSSGMGGQFYKPGSNPLGSSRNSLIYMWNGKGEPVGGHAVTLVGWGTFKDTDGLFIPYWICLNSWGREWGTNGYPNRNQRESYPAKLDEGGYFWMVRGIDNCGIEKNACAGQPNMGNISYPGTIEKYGWGLPYPELSNISLIPGERKLETPEITIKFGDLIDGGGTYGKNYGNNNWEILAMDPPSPFVLFWPEERPLYCLGKITKRVSALDQDIYIDNDAFLKLRMAAQFLTSPILVINDEQVQIIDNNVFMTKIKSTARNDSLALQPKKLKVNRGVNRSKPQIHNVGSFVKIFPYKDLSIPEIEKMNFKRCENVFLGTIMETSNLTEVCNKLDDSKRILGS